MRKFLLSLLVMLIAGMDYAFAATLPSTSTPDKPALYYIRNTRANKFAVLNSTSENMGLTSDKSQAAMFWFEAAGELINDTYLPVKIHNITTSMAMSSFSAWIGDGNTWYIRENTVNTEFLGIGGAAGEEGNTSLWWNDYSGAGTTVGSWCLTGDGGSIWDIVAVPEDEIPAGITVITWNLKKGNQVISTVKSAAVQGVTYPAPFGSLACDGGSATGGTNDQTVDIPYKENIPFVSSESASNATWYKAIMRGNKYLHYDNPEVSCTTDNSSKNDLGSYFAFVGDVINGFRIYNAALPAGKALGGKLGDRLTAVPEEEAPSFILENNSGHFVFRNPESSIGYLNDNSSYLGYWITSAGATDGGSTWTFEPVDEKQSELLNNTTVIASAEDFEKFAKAVNDGEVFTNAVLVNDIDLGSSNTMVGTNDGTGAYQGTFDGQGHTIKIDMNTTANYTAVFRYVGWRAVVENVKISGTITTTGKFAAGIAGRVRGTVRGCYADVTIVTNLSGDGTHGGLAGTCTNGAIIKDCLVKVTMLGESTENCGGVIGWADSKPNIVNCLVVTDGSTINTGNGNSRNLARNDGNVLGITNLEAYNTDSYNNRPAPECYNNYATVNWDVNNANTKGVTIVPLADLADGKICYQLNTDQKKINWKQTIGTDPFPVPAAFGNGQVYASGATDCKGTSTEALTYTNTASNAVTTAHTFDKYGLCTTCGLHNFDYFDYDNPAKFDAVSRSVLLSSKEDIDQAEGLSRIVNGFKLHMKMVNDIEYIAEPGHFIFNASDWQEGDFDGDGHALTIEMTEMGSNAALFPQRHYGSVENLIMHGKIETSGQYWGSISNDSYERLVRNVYSDIHFTSTHVGDNTAGGFFGMIRTSKNIENCIFAGTIDLPGAAGGSRCARVGGIAGWTHASTNITNCAILGHINGAGDETLDNDTENSGNIARNYGNVITKNVYVAYPIKGKSITDQNKYTAIENIESIANGELAFLLNEGKPGGENFYQVIGTDPQPMPFAKDGGKVYTVADSYTCDGKPQGNITYVNEEVIPNLPAHEFVDGICANCGNIEEDEDGYAKIINTKTMVAFATKVNGGQADLKARMYEDIDMKGVAYTPAGNTGRLYVGEFDGQKHVFSNFNYNGGDYSGLFGVIGDGAIIKNFVLDKTCSINGNAFCGVIGGTNGGGNVYISGIGNEGNVTGTAQNASGILGVDMGGSATLHINNCYVTGAIKGARESAVICSWSNDASVVENCWSIASLEGIYGTNSFTRGGTTVKDCYEVDIEGIEGQQYGDDHTKDKTNLLSMDDLASGKFCYDFNKRAGEDLLGQNLAEGDPYPTFRAINGTTEVVYDEELGYYNPLPARIKDCKFENVVSNDIVKSADIKSEITLTAKADDITGNAVALIMDAAEYAQKGIIGGKHLFGAIGKNGGITVDGEGKLNIKFTSYSTHTDQPIFADSLGLARKDVGDVTADAKYVVIIYGGSLVIEGEVWPENIVEVYDGSSVISLVIDNAVRALFGEEDPTAINEVNTDNKNTEIFSITGVRVNKAQKGIYIINGKKTAVK